MPENFVGDSWSFQYVSSKAGREVELNLTVNIPDPQLWWPLNIGSQNLYRLQLSLQPQAGTEQTFDTTFALRTIRMEGACGQEWEQYKWMFIINERPVFIKGSNWCTTDVLLRFPEERYERFLLLAACANIQLLRAWGGGMPENDTFYRLCDKLGIMVIQEWPTCWDSQKEQPISELEETVRCHMLRLRNHPSLVMWCGGNESKEADGEAMEMMGRLAYELDGSRPFHRTEPWGGSLHDYTTYWDMGDLDYSLGLKSVFLGEFGMASSPNFESVMRYLPEEEKISGLRKDLVHLVIILQDLINWIRMTWPIWRTALSYSAGWIIWNILYGRPKWPRLQVFAIHWKHIGVVSLMQQVSVTTN